MTLAEYSDYLISTMHTDGWCFSPKAEYALMHLQVFMD